MPKNAAAIRQAKPASGRPGVTTLAMVAAAAGVSPSTVSRIINGSADVTPARRAAVEAAIAQLNFRPNPAARGLAGGRSMTVGVVTQAIDSPYYGEGLRGIESALQAVGYAPLFMSGQWRGEEEARCIAQLLARRVDGIIVFAGRLGDKELAAYARQVPVVVTGRKLRGSGLFSLTVDDRQGAALATRHLLELGHRRIAFIAGPPDHADAIERMEGYKQALDEAHIRFDPALVAQGDFHEAGGGRAVDELIAAGTPFTALFCANDQMAHGAYLALFRKGLRIPDEVSVVGFDDLLASAYMLPPLTSIRQSVLALGQCSAQALLQMIGGQRPRVTLPPVQLVVRESTRRPPANGRSGKGKNGS
jgi:LacI family transcriptional regulator